jgi:AdoMet-dependent rRNA methyltransferase SPB1
MGRRTKGQDRDKYYRLAKDQGYRARSAFKLIEINRRHDFLSKAKVCIDLCAAPGGWCQVAQKTMPAGSIVLGVDIQPIRPIRGVKTLVGDITTDSCAAAIRRELQGWKADAVLCDGAPNIGTSFGKDAYVQNEIALAALKVATQHLTPGGTFVTKVYRSSDYNAFVWAVKHFFESQHTVKPASSRQQSAEIFIVGEGYLAPERIDPRMLDPRHVYVEDGGDSATKKGITIFHKKFDQHNKRQRQGYDDDLGMTLQRKGSASAFIDSEDPIRLLTDLHVIEFSTPECEEHAKHPATTEEVRLACGDLRVLSKTDFKALLKWRLKVRETRAAKRAEEMGPDEEENGEEEASKEEVDSEEEIQAEIRDLRVKHLAERKRLRKKEREKAGKLQKRAAMGMMGGSMETQEDMDLFSLSTIRGTSGDLNAIAEVDLNQPEESEEEEEVGESGGEGEEDGSDVDYSEILEGDLNAAYERYLAGGKNEGARAGTRHAKRSKVSRDAEAAAVVMEDAVLYDGDRQRYLEMLAAGGSSDDSSDDDSDSSDDEGDVDSASGGANRGRKKPKSLPGAGLLTDLDDGSREGPDAVSRRWFSNDIFAGVEDGADEEEEADDVPGAAAAAADDVISSMPKTDKELRKDRRRRGIERRERKEMRHKEPELEIVSAKQMKTHHPSSGRVEGDKHLKMIKAGMGKAAGLAGPEDHTAVVEIVSSAAATAAAVRGLPLPVHDDRAYDSEEELYDDEDKARHLALGAMMLKRHRKKELIDAAYNRYSWNDPKGLPEWFLDDENKHFRPQVPIAPELLAKMRERFVSLSTKPIKKVAEARARKRKRVALKLKAATKQAESLASNPDMSEREKLRIVKNALRKGGGAEKPTKAYVVAKKFQGGKPTKSGVAKGSKVKFVDSRMRSDTRGMKRAEKKKGKRSKGGKRR